MVGMNMTDANTYIGMLIRDKAFLRSEYQKFLNNCYSVSEINGIISCDMLRNLLGTAKHCRIAIRCPLRLLPGYLIRSARTTVLQKATCIRYSPKAAAQHNMQLHSVSNTRARHMALLPNYAWQNPGWIRCNFIRTCC